MGHPVETQIVEDSVEVQSVLDCDKPSEEIKILERLELIDHAVLEPAQESEKKFIYGIEWTCIIMDTEALF